MKNTSTFKKTFLIAGGLLFSLLLNAQSQNGAIRKGPVGPSGDNLKAITSCTLTSTNNYTAGTTMLLTFTLTFASPDYEYLDGFGMTFPAGMTPLVTGTSSPLATPNGCSGVTILVNPVSGQTITWGELVTPSGCGALVQGTFTFSVNVTIGAGVSGDQTVSFTTYGDGYGGTPHTCSGTCVVSNAVAIDAASVSVDVNDFVTTGTAQPALSTFRNNGASPASFNVTMQINPGGYTSTQNISSLAAGALQQVTFTPSWTPPSNGYYNVTIYTSLAGDLNHANDTLRKTIYASIIPPRKAFVYNAYDPTAAEGPGSLYINNPIAFNLLVDQTSSNFASGGAWINNMWYASIYSDNNLVTIDTLTGARTVVGALGWGINGMAYDYTTSVLYGISHDGTNTQLNTINTSTGAATIVGNVVAGIMVALGCDHLGNLYGVNIADDNLYSINKTTGAGTIIGPLGFDAGYAQGMDYEFYSGQMFLFGYDAAGDVGELRLLDLNNGNAYYVNTFFNDSEMDAPAFVNSCKTDAAFITDTVCFGAPTHFTDLSTGVTIAGQYQWDVNNDGSIDYTTRGNITHTYTAPGIYTAKLKIIDAFCNDSVFIQVLVDPCTGFTEYTENNIPSVYPNPNSGSFTMNFPASINGNVNITVHNLMGQIIYQRSEFLSGMNNELLIKPEGITSGIYLVKAVSSEKTFTYKIVVE